MCTRLIRSDTSGVDIQNTLFNSSQQNEAQIFYNKILDNFEKEIDMRFRENQCFLAKAVEAINCTSKNILSKDLLKPLVDLAELLLNDFKI